ncbi:MAG: virulence RhuM family protein [Bacteroidaceae bacterium]|nr:virulence RhuM family protein [Bacteroidaceae bacterium]
MEEKGQILLYQTPDGESRIEVRLQGETVWLNQEQMAEQFQRNKSTISRHINNAFEEGELTPEATVAFFATVQTEGNRQVERDIAFYNLDMIISVGYRVHSYRGVQFRILSMATVWGERRSRVSESRRKPVFSMPNVSDLDKMSR